MQTWFGLHLTSYTHPDVPPAQLFDRTVEQAKAGEAAGFRLVTVMDHIYQIQGVGAVDEPMLEGWSALAARAREKKRVSFVVLAQGPASFRPRTLIRSSPTSARSTRCRQEAMRPCPAVPNLRPIGRLRAAA